MNFNISSENLCGNGGELSEGGKRDLREFLEEKIRDNKLFNTNKKHLSP